MRQSILHTEILCTVFWLFIILLSAHTQAEFVRKETITGAQFLEKFEFFSEKDPNDGYVNWISKEDNDHIKLAEVIGNTFNLKVDTHNPPNNRGRNSVRIQSKNFYGDGLIVLSLNHVPTGCAVWPSFWTNGREPWPFNGEIDVIDATNKMTRTRGALHTGPGCDMTSTSSIFDGKWVQGATICDAQANDNSGCAIESNEEVVGHPLNKIQGGVFVVQKDSSRFIRMWFFRHNEVPQDLNDDNPKPDQWIKKPFAYFVFGQHCEGKNLFQEQRVIIQTNLCGNWAGKTFPGGCMGTYNGGIQVQSCEDLVRNVPSAFFQAYWSINYLKIFESTAISSVVKNHYSPLYPTYPTTYSHNPPKTDSNYALVEESISGDILKKFRCYSGPDLAGGYVDYVDLNTARQLGLIEEKRSLILRVDSRPSFGRRKAVRLESNDFYQDGLFVLDINHVPEGLGSWSSFWSFGQGECPEGGNIDILTGVNELTKIRSSIRTKSGCTMNSNLNEFDGRWITGPDCSVNANKGSGCSIESSSTSLGPYINRYGGALVVMELKRESHIKIWVFHRNEIPQDIAQKRPNPSTWSQKPLAQYLLNTNCDGFNYFSAQKFVIHTSLCGSWASNDFPDPLNAKVPGLRCDKQQLCERYVSGNSCRLDKAYWEINRFSYYSISNPTYKNYIPYTTVPGKGNPIRPVSNGYRQIEALNGNNFLKAFRFFTEKDPNNGFVDYVCKREAERLGLVAVEGSSFLIRTDTSQFLGRNGRKTVRLESKKLYDSGLFVINLSHIPEGCGVWPTFWMVGEEWPQNGEIDIINGVNEQTNVRTILHTTHGCTMPRSPLNFDGKWLSNDCSYHVNDNQGCAIEANDQTSFGTQFNRKGGAVFVVDFDRHSHIKVWQFNKTEVPVDVFSEPKPWTWNKAPYAHFPLRNNCNGVNKFGPQRLVFQTNFCGSWAGNAFPKSCGNFSLLPNASPMDLCVDHVRNNGNAFSEAFWKIEGLTIFRREPFNII